MSVTEGYLGCELKKEIQKSSVGRNRISNLSVNAERTRMMVANALFQAEMRWNRLAAGMLKSGTPNVIQPCNGLD